MKSGLFILLVIGVAAWVQFVARQEPKPWRVPARPPADPEAGPEQIGSDQ